MAKAILTGGVIGIFVLVSAVLLRGQVSELLSRNSPSPTVEQSVPPLVSREYLSRAFHTR
ncbi:hypothetical protein [Acaryochloris sp. CCMEE 5410]|uniref:hypothetical protein n=1 Tax=Acaryochloris sp. CCMEE 5410 TaxID=310037 RepID=UPI0021CEB1BA|nr:hypothetical protein [Acaryochloris sp. CCMEE 5410]